MSAAPDVSSGFTCPVPLSHRTEITVGHGGGGRLTQELIERIFRPAFANPSLDAQHDGAQLRFPNGATVGSLLAGADGARASSLAHRKPILQTHLSRRGSVRS